MSGTEKNTAGRQNVIISGRYLGQQQKSTSKQQEEVRLHLCNAFCQQRTYEIHN